MKKEDSLDGRIFFRRSDIAVVAIILFVALGIWGWVMFAPQPESKNIEIICDGKLTETIALPADDDIIALGEDEHVKLEVKDNQIRVLETDCPDKICVRTGFISKVGQSAVCLPNRIVVKITGGNGNETGVDGIAG